MVGSRHTSEPDRAHLPSRLINRLPCNDRRGLLRDQSVLLPMDVSGGFDLGLGDNSGSHAAAEAAAGSEFSVTDELKSQAIFRALLHSLPDALKCSLLVQALETCGPDCLVGLEEARDAILYAAARIEPALLRSVTSFLEEADLDESAGEDGGDADDADMAGEEMHDDDGGIGMGPVLGSAAAAAAAAAATDTYNAAYDDGGEGGFGDGDGDDDDDDDDLGEYSESNVNAGVQFQHEDDDDGGGDDDEGGGDEDEEVAGLGDNLYDDHDPDGFGLTAAIAAQPASVSGPGSAAAGDAYL